MDKIGGDISGFFSGLFQPKEQEDQPSSAKSPVNLTPFDPDFEGRYNVTFEEERDKQIEKKIEEEKEKEKEEEEEEEEEEEKAGIASLGFEVSSYTAYSSTLLRQQEIEKGKEKEKNEEEEKEREGAGRKENDKEKDKENQPNKSLPSQMEKKEKEKEKEQGKYDLGGHIGEEQEILHSIDSMRSVTDQVVVASLSSSSSSSSCTLAIGKGIQVGDIIVKVEGNEVKNLAAFQAVMEALGSLRPLTIELERCSVKTKKLDTTHPSSSKASFSSSTNSNLTTRRRASSSSSSSTTTTTTTSNNAFTDFFSGLSTILPPTPPTSYSSASNNKNSNTRNTQPDISPEERRARLLQATQNRNKAWESKLEKNRNLKEQKNKLTKAQQEKEMERMANEHEKSMQNRITKDAVFQAKAHESLMASKLGYNPYEAQIRGNSANATGHTNSSSSSISSLRKDSLNRSSSTKVTVSTANDNDNNINSLQGGGREKLKSSSSTSLVVGDDLPLHVHTQDELFKQQVQEQFTVIQSILNTHDISIRRKLYVTISKIIANIVKDPRNEKYRKVRLANPNIQGAIVVVDGGVELMTTCGFEIQVFNVEEKKKEKKIEQKQQEQEEFFYFSLKDPLESPENIEKLSKIYLLHEHIIALA